MADENQEEWLSCLCVLVVVMLCVCVCVMVGLSCDCGDEFIVRKARACSVGCSLCDALMGKHDLRMLMYYNILPAVAAILLLIPIINVLLAV